MKFFSETKEFTFVYDNLQNLTLIFVRVTAMVN